MTVSRISLSSPPTDEECAHLDSFASIIRQSKRCVVVTGAGVSVSGGLFDSDCVKNIFKRIEEKHPTTTIHKRQLFSVSTFENSFLNLKSPFYSFMGEFKSVMDSISPSKAHEILKLLNDAGKLVRVYTENIDSMEARVPLCKDPTPNYSQSKVVNLYGNINVVRCDRGCGYKGPWDDRLTRVFKSGQTLTCPECTKQVDDETCRGKLRPDIVLDGERNENGHDIERALECDITTRPDLLIVMGSCLQSPELVFIVEELSKVVKSDPLGKVVYMNSETISLTVDGLFDVRFEARPDTICEYLINRHFSRLPLEQDLDVESLPWESTASSCDEQDVISSTTTDSCDYDEDWPFSGDTSRIEASGNSSTCVFNDSYYPKRPDTPDSDSDSFDMIKDDCSFVDFDEDVSIYRDNSRNESSVKSPNDFSNDGSVHKRPETPSDSETFSSCSLFHDDISDEEKAAYDLVIDKLKRKSGCISENWDSRETRITTSDGFSVVIRKTPVSERIRNIPLDVLEKMMNVVKICRVSGRACANVASHSGAGFTYVNADTGSPSRIFPNHALLYEHLWDMHDNEWESFIVPLKGKSAKKISRSPQNPTDTAIHVTIQKRKPGRPRKQKRARRRFNSHTHVGIDEQTVGYDDVPEYFQNPTTEAYDGNVDKTRNVQFDNINGATQATMKSGANQFDVEGPANGQREIVIEANTATTADSITVHEHSSTTVAPLDDDNCLHCTSELDEIETAVTNIRMEKTETAEEIIPMADLNEMKIMGFVKPIPKRGRKGTRYYTYMRPVSGTHFKSENFLDKKLGLTSEDAVLIYLWRKTHAEDAKETNWRNLVYHRKK